MYRIGFACKFTHHGQSLKKKKLEEIERPYRPRITTARWLDQQDQHVAEQRLKDLITHNVEATARLVAWVGQYERELRMLRIGSDLLPMYTHPKWKNFYTDNPSFMAGIQEQFRRIGIVAREKDVRLSFHPGQFTVLASDRPEVVENSIEEFEYHADMLRWMGYGRTFQDAKCNVHISGKLGPQGIIDILPRLSEVARNVITIENDEMSYGLDASLELADHLALVIDVHHHWVRTGEYLQPDDERVKAVIASWRGKRPTMHYSLSREDLLVDHCRDTKPNMDKLLEQGYKKQKLRAHSDYMWNRECNKWAAGFLGNFDIMVESKAKNLASFKLYNEIK
jgi:UV damage endonuclease UvdE